MATFTRASQFSLPSKRPESTFRATYRRRRLALLNALFCLLVLYFPLLSPIASEAQSTGNTRFGTAISGPEYGTDGCYNDVFMMGAFSSTFNGTPVTLNSDGYPTAVGKYAQLVVVISGGYPSGDTPDNYYKFFGRGKFKIMGAHGINFGAGPNYGFAPNATGGGNSLQYDATTDITTGLVSITMPPPPPTNAPTWRGATIPGPVLQFDVMPTDANDPPSDFHLMRPDVPAWYDGWTAKNSIFGKQYLEGLKPYCCIRFIGWMFNEPNLVTGGVGNWNGFQSYGVTDWASRPSPTYFNPNQRGVCYENMIELCNELNCDMWLCVPYYAAGGLDGKSPTDWSVNMANMIKQKLKPGLHLYYEIWDEVWNYAVPNYWFGTTQIQDWAAANSDITSFFPTDGWFDHGAETALLLMNVEQIFQPILGSRQRAILSGQIGYNIYCSGGLQWIAHAYGPPAKYIWAIAGAPYVGPSSSDPATTPLFTSMQDFLTQTLIPMFKQNVTLADQYGVKWCCYECGQGLIAANAAQFPAYEAAQSDPRMAAVYYNEVAALKSVGADLCCWLNFCQGDGSPGFWGALTDIRQMANKPPPVKYQAQVNIAASCKCGIASRAALTPAQLKAQQQAAAAAAKAAAAKARAAAEAKLRAAEAALKAKQRAAEEARKLAEAKLKAEQKAAEEAARKK